jgi:hypothetical protein
VLLLPYATILGLDAATWLHLLAVVLTEVVHRVVVVLVDAAAVQRKVQLAARALCLARLRHVEITGWRKPCKKAHLFLSFAYVCPEPVLVKLSFLA